MATQSIGEDEGIAARFAAVRALSRDIAAPLSDADATLQPHPDASPAKWHLAHTTWFFETFVLRDCVPGYALHDDRFPFLFNSYYEGEGERHARARRGMISRPSLDEVRAYRDHVDAALAAAIPGLPPEALALIELGLNHEQQHQELMLMDLKAAFFENPLHPAIWPAQAPAPVTAPSPLGWTEGRSGIARIGHDGRGFAFDCEGPAHDVLLRRHAIADRLVTNGEWRTFMDDGGYEMPALWLSDGWAWVQTEKVRAPLYWVERDSGWHRFGLDGLQPVAAAEPVMHVNYYEADAFARWAGARLPTEAEWESAAAAADPAAGHQLDAAGPVRPLPGGALFGDVWNWTASAYLPHPGFAPAEGTVGEYNGKFMCGQFVLKGASCGTPRGHSRASYRNFFYPHQRWQFAGVRLAKDL
ncbi:ergothioneine biosynthesis protein EgtB [Allosphingosinicella indica]|uniref:Ergothioneine biosynthesis protein EgtB n=1 Tax=Allosphingosinicella indica TaxID=941907 RepID=A0A1X7G7V3_9SPHN|nr:ergothioneine biosynthesis protein EgtB [Allosphingosinicella indica]SMF64810.1 ergothioneine biosynthesis protein EgtB [Allosphingosinicella indica]